MSKEILLTQDKVAIVDDADFYWLNQLKWYAQKHRNTWYAMRHNSRKNGKPKVICMHRQILNPLMNFETDHKDHNGLNNRRKNLRPATRAQNQRNQIKIHAGVTYCERDKRWMARIRHEGKRIYLGCYKTRTEAIRTYNQTVCRLSGEFASTNL